MALSLRRSLITAALILILGAAINIGVAWTLPLIERETRARYIFVESGLDALDRPPRPPRLLILERAGFPHPALTCEYRTMPIGDIWRDGLEIAPGYNLPIQPLHPGFAINTIFYATIAAAVFLAPIPLHRILLRRHNRRRGQCTRCHYSGAGLASDATCPECGSARGAISA